MKSIDEFTSPAAYWTYVHTQTTVNVMCVLVSKPHWKDYKEAAKEAVKIADEVVKVLSK